MNSNDDNMESHKIYNNNENVNSNNNFDSSNANNNQLEENLRNGISTTDCADCADSLVTSNSNIGEEFNEGSAVLIGSFSDHVHIHMDENEILRNQMKDDILDNLININFKDEIKRIIQNAEATFNINEQSEQIIFNIFKQVDNSNFLEILKEVMVKKNNLSNMDYFKITNYERKIINHKNFVHNSNRSKLVTLQYEENDQNNTSRNMNCIVRSENCLLGSDKKKIIDKIINSNFDITLTSTSLASTSIVNTFKEDEYELLDSFTCEYFCFSVCVKNEFNTYLEFYKNIVRPDNNDDESGKFYIRAQCKDYDTFFESFVDFLI
ncbi:hypothetical protein PFMC_01380 [Plasmodium falciparum CAMP/Malaysia]|nr:hypothetical protein PFMC_01380 [Plasmodium falciparum CAMP/Malaysia]